VSGLQPARLAWHKLRRLARTLNETRAYFTWGSAPSVRIFALLAFRNEMRYLAGFFENVSPHVDGIIALDDGSTDGSGEFVARQPNVLTLLRLPAKAPHVWNDGRNHRLLVQAAWPYRPDWLIGVDADERLERNFRSRAIREIVRAKNRGYQAYTVALRELWNAPDTYRADGIWGRKRVARFFASRLDHEFDDRELHGNWGPLNSRRNGGYPDADLIIYHLRMIHEDDRRVRQARYEAIDPERRWQAFGYSYMMQNNGLALRTLPRGRDYRSPGR
jgi:glycosyltransferase involved in cell wall biosynthesis